jgi:hypothetical protein
LASWIFFARALARATCTVRSSSRTLSPDRSALKAHIASLEKEGSSKAA